MSSSSLKSSCRIISFDEIRHEDGSAPFDFDKGKILGKGGEATVYLACLYTGQKKTLIAVKQLKYIHGFESEIQTMSKIHHSNTVSLLGYCDQSDKKILIYEYMEKGNLTDYIMPKADSIILSWKERLNICLGAARGLQYLHTATVEFPKGIIHRDIKPDNILINENWVGKIADFGMVKLSHADQVKSTMITNIKGTMGFYAPEYLSFGKVSRKIDVYAFGVVLFYVLCLKSPWDRGAESYYRREDEDLGLYAQQCIDTRIKEEISDDSLKVYTDTIQGSLQVDPKLRPDMGTVVLKLEKALECQNLQDEAKRGTSGMENKHEIAEVEVRSALEGIASTGKYWHEWEKLKSMLSFYLKQVLSKYPEARMNSDEQSTTLGESYMELAKRLDDALDSFVEGPPFTIQRLSEILLGAQNIYPKLSKLALALEKNLLVKSTLSISSNSQPPVMIETPIGPEKAIEEPQLQSDAVQNGVEPMVADRDEIMADVEADADDDMKIDMAFEEIVRSSEESSAMYFL